MEKYIAVIGGMNIDITGTSNSPIVANDSNPGKITFGLGGVGRNIAHNLCLLGVPVKLFTAFGDDFYADIAKKSCEQLGMDTSCSLFVPGGRSSTYLCVCSPNGEMEVAVNDMEICDKITPEYIERNISVLSSAELVIIDTNISEESIRYLAKHCSAPIFADPVSTIKAAKLKPVLKYLDTVKPNKIEAEYLSGIKITDEESLKTAAKKLLDLGVKNVFISCGKEGVFAASGENSALVPCYPAEKINCTGSGDCFVAALGWARLKGFSLLEAAAFANKASALAIQSTETINPKLSENYLLSE